MTHRQEDLHAVLAAAEAERTILRAQIAALQDRVAAMDQIELASSAKSAFLANMSHEIRTPLNGILGILQILCEGDAPRHIREDLETVRHSAESLLELLDDILDFSKIEAGKLSLEDIEFDLCRTVEDVVDLFADAAQRKGLELFSSFSAAVPERVRGDPGRLRQVLTNLLGNAVKFTPQGEVEIRVDCVPGEGGSLCVRVAVRDSGIGMSSDQCARLFRPFAQADASTTRKYGGTGLGLCISEQLCRIMGGGLSVESELGKGSTFACTLAVQRGAMPVGGAATVLADDILGGRRLLVVEPNESLRARLHEQASAWGMQVEAVPDCAAARFLVGASGPEKAFAAALVASTAGADADCRWLRGDPAAGHVRVIGGYQLHARAVFARGEATAEVDAVLHKPYRRYQLHRVLVEVLGLSHPQPAEAGAGRAPGVRLGKRVLVVEDMPVNQRVTMRSLELLGYDVDLATDGGEAIEKATAREYALVLMDCQMPVLDGYQATGRLRALGGRFASLPIVAMTADAMAGTRERCLQAGMSDYISKPVRLADLRTLLQRWS